MDTLYNQRSEKTLISIKMEDFKEQRDQISKQQ